MNQTLFSAFILAQKTWGGQQKKQGNGHLQEFRNSRIQEFFRTLSEISSSDPREGTFHKGTDDRLIPVLPAGNDEGKKGIFMKDLSGPHMGIPAAAAAGGQDGDAASR